MLTRLAVAALAVVALHAPAEAQSKKTLGAVLAIAGGGMMAGAFDYRADVCPDGYSTHTFHNRPTECLFVSSTPPFNTDVQEATTKATLKRQRLLWAGLGAAVGGVVLLLLPGETGQAASRAVDVQIAPDRVKLGKTFSW